jgi:hypothetical protein
MGLSNPAGASRMDWGQGISMKVMKMAELRRREKLGHLLDEGSSYAAAVVAFEEEAQRLCDRLGLKESIVVRGHVDDDGEPCYGLTLLLWRGLTPLLIGTIAREVNQTALVLVDRSGNEPVVRTSLFG